MKIKRIILKLCWALEAIGAIILGVIGGLALGAIIEAVAKPKCPVCHSTIEKETIICQCSS